MNFETLVSNQSSANTEHTKEAAAVVAASAAAAAAAVTATAAVVEESLDNKCNIMRTSCKIVRINHKTERQIVLTSKH